MDGSASYGKARFSTREIMDETRSLVFDADGHASFVPQPFYQTPRIGAKDVVPAAWNHFHVARRLRHACQVIEALPLDPTSSPRKFGASWMPYRYTMEDWRAQAEPFSPCRRYVRDLKLRNVRANSVRFSPSRDDIVKMEEAIQWPMEHLPDDPVGSWLILARASGLKKTTRVQTLTSEFDPFEKATPELKILGYVLKKNEVAQTLEFVSDRYPVWYGGICSHKELSSGQIVAWERAAKLRVVSGLIEGGVKVK